MQVDFVNMFRDEVSDLGYIILLGLISDAVKLIETMMMSWEVNTCKSQVQDG